MRSFGTVGMIELETTGDGVVLPVKAHPGASRNGVQGWQNGMLRVSVTQIAEKGKANKVLRAVIAKDLGLRKSQIVLVSGETNSQKRFLVQGVEAIELAARVERQIHNPENTE